MLMKYIRELFLLATSATSQAQNTASRARHVIGEKDLQSIFNYYCFDEYISALETVVLRSQAESAGAIFQLEMTN